MQATGSLTARSYISVSESVSPVKTARCRRAPPQVAAPQRSVLLTQPSSAASLDDDSFVKLLLQENDKNDVEAVRKGLADAIDVDENPLDLRSVLLVDFFYDVLQFCRRHSFSSLKTSECLKLLDKTRQRLCEQNGCLDAVVPYFKEELLALTVVRTIEVQEVQIQEEVIREAVTSMDSGGVGPRSKGKLKGRTTDLDAPVTFVDRVIQKQIVTSKPISLAPVFDYNDCTVIIDYTAMTLFQHSSLYAHVYSAPQMGINHKLHLFVHDCFPPAPLAQARAAPDHEIWRQRQRLCNQETTARNCIASEEAEASNAISTAGASHYAEVLQRLQEQQADDQHRAMPPSDVQLAIKCLTYNLTQGDDITQLDGILEQRLQAIENAIAAKTLEAELPKKKKSFMKI